MRVIFLNLKQFFNCVINRKFRNMVDIKTNCEFFIERVFNLYLVDIYIITKSYRIHLRFAVVYPLMKITNFIRFLYIIYIRTVKIIIQFKMKFLTLLFIVSY